ncbi:MAG: TonB-dependent receptor [Bacteroidota bacterium]
MNIKRLAHLAITLCTITAIAQENSISGTVTDQTGNPITGANVAILETSKGTSTKNDGSYNITGLSNKSYFIQVSYLGYQTITKSLRVPFEGEFNFQLSQTSDQLGEVVVTANRRYEDIQKTAASVSAIGPKQVEQLQVKQFTELNSIAPNFRSYDDGANGSFTLFASRGISTIDNNPAIGLYVDDVPYFNTFAFPLSLADVEQIEVLRGPQGTLYGRNALAGVIKITSKKPQNTLTGYATVGVGNLNANEYAFALSTPIVKDKLFFRANMSIQERDGFVENTVTGEDLQDREAVEGNFRLRYYANDKLSLNLQYSLQRRESNAYAFVLATPDNTLQDILANAPFQVSFNEDVFRETITQNLALSLKYDFGSFSLNSVTAFQDTDLEALDEFDYSPLSIQAAARELEYQNISQELRLVSTSNTKLSWIAGAFLYRTRDDDSNDFITGSDFGLVDPDFAALVPFTRTDRADIIQQGYALYGQASFEVTDKISLSAGLRYDFEENEATINRTFDSPAFPATEFSGSTDFDSFSPKVAISYQANDNTFVFANVARGFRPGGINQFVLDETQTGFDSENTLNYELGIKNNFFNNRLKLNLTGFFITYNNQQVFTLLNLANFDLGTDNIGESQSFGLELESQWAISRGLSLGLNLGYLNTEVLEFSPIDFNTGQPVDFSGNDLPISPEFNGNINLNYIQPISKKINFESSLDYTYQSDVFFDVGNELIQEAYGILNGRVGLTTKNFDLFLWGKNITDETYFSYGFGVSGFNNAAFALPQTYGATLTAKF